MPAPRREEPSAAGLDAESPESDSVVTAASVFMMRWRPNEDLAGFAGCKRKGETGRDKVFGVE